jgi:hypothetical protein
MIQRFALMRILRHEIWKPTFEKQSQSPSCRDLDTVFSPVREPALKQFVAIATASSYEFEEKHPSDYATLIGGMLTIDNPM